MIELKQGCFYKSGTTIFLVGRSVPCIANRWVCRITKTGRLSAIDAIYYRQHNHFKLLRKKFRVDSKYEEKLQRLFSVGPYGNLKSLRDWEIPNVDKFLKK